MSWTCCCCSHCEGGVPSECFGTFNPLEYVLFVWGIIASCWCSLGCLSVVSCASVDPKPRTMAIWMRRRQPSHIFESQALTLLFFANALLALLHRSLSIMLPLIQFVLMWPAVYYRVSLFVKPKQAKHMQVLTRSSLMSHCLGWPQETVPWTIPDSIQDCTVLCTCLFICGYALFGRVCLSAYLFRLHRYRLANFQLVIANCCNNLIDSSLCQYSVDD